MSLQPKNRKYRLSFRNKTRIRNNLPKDIRIRKLRNNLSLKTNSFYKGLPHYKNSEPFLYESQSTILNRGLPVNMNSRAFKLTLVKKGVEVLRNQTNIGSLETTTFLFKSKKKVEERLTNKQIKSILMSSQNPLATNFTSAITGTSPKFGSCGLYFCSSGTVSSKFIETIRLTIARKLKKVGRFWIRVYPDTPVTARSAETRMGRGKGAISHYEAKIRPGQMFIEFSGVPQESVRQIYQQISKKTPIPISLVS